MPNIEHVTKKGDDGKIHGLRTSSGYVFYERLKKGAGSSSSIVSAKGETQLGIASGKTLYKQVMSDIGLLTNKSTYNINLKNGLNYIYALYQSEHDKEIAVMKELGFDKDYNDAYTDCNWGKFIDALNLLLWGEKNIGIYKRNLKLLETTWKNAKKRISPEDREKWSKRKQTPSFFGGDTYLGQASRDPTLIAELKKDMNDLFDRFFSTYNSANNETYSRGWTNEFILNTFKKKCENEIRNAFSRYYGEVMKKALIKMFNAHPELYESAGITEAEIEEMSKAYNGLESFVDKLRTNSILFKRLESIFGFTLDFKDGIKKLSESQGEKEGRIQPYRIEIGNMSFTYYDVNDSFKSIKKDKIDTRTPAIQSLTDQMVEVAMSNFRLDKSFTLSNKVQGDMSEIMQGIVFTLVKNKLTAAAKQSGAKVKVQEEWMGREGLRPDNVLAFNVHVDVLKKLSIKTEKTTGQNGEITHEGAIINAKKLGDYLNKQKSGFIIYSSSKNYLATTIQDGGFTGSSLTLDAYETQMNSMNKHAIGTGRGLKFSSNVKSLTGLILQTCKGAVLSSGKKKEEIEKQMSNLIAQDMASFLFDDWTSIGEEYHRGEQRGKAIHLMDLNGIKIPLSYLLYKLYDAYRLVIQKNLNNNIANVCNINIISPDILYPDDSYLQIMKSNEAWNNQKEDARQNIQIDMHFARSMGSWNEFDTTVKGSLGKSV